MDRRQLSFEDLHNTSSTLINRQFINVSTHMRPIPTETRPPELAVAIGMHLGSPTARRPKE